jgi:hypothetical protein
MSKFTAFVLALSMSVCSGCVLDSIFVREKHVQGRRPYVSSYTIPNGIPYQIYWRDKADFLNRKAAEANAGKLTKAEIELVGHLYDYKRMFNELNKAVAEYNKLAREHNQRNGYED